MKRGWSIQDKPAALVEELITQQGVECAKQPCTAWHSGEPSPETLHKSLFLLKPPHESSSISGDDGSSPSEGIDKKSDQRMRELMPKWTEQVRVATENGLEGPPEDGYSWRKYGQEVTPGAKYPRSYYRCRQMHNCLAKKQVQRSNGDPNTFEITYRGAHICAQTLPTKQKPEENIQESDDHLAICYGIIFTIIIIIILLLLLLLLSKVLYMLS